MALLSEVYRKNDLAGMLPKPTMSVQKVGSFAVCQLTHSGAELTYIVSTDRNGCVAQGKLHVSKSTVSTNLAFDVSAFSNATVLTISIRNDKFEEVGFGSIRLDALYFPEAGFVKQEFDVGGPCDHTDSFLPFSPCEDDYDLLLDCMLSPGKVVVQNNIDAHRLRMVLKPPMKLYLSHSAIGDTTINVERLETAEEAGALLVLHSDHAIAAGPLLGTKVSLKMKPPSVREA